MTTIPGFTVYASGVQYVEFSCADDDVACIIRAGELADIQDVVYADNSQPNGTPINPSFLPPLLSSNIAACDTTEGCTMIGYDFIQEKAELGSASSYIVSTEATSSTDQAVLYKMSGASIAYIIVTNPGSGYQFDSPPPVTVGLPTAGVACVTATATATLTNGSVTSLTLSKPGGGYTQGAPTVQVTSGSARITATVNSLFQVSGFTIVDGGSGYTDAPGIVITPPPTVNATQAIAHANISRAGLVSNIVMTVQGSGYITPPDIVIGPPTRGGQQATAVAIITSIPVLDTPPGYTYNVLPLTGTPISPQTTQKNDDTCAALCDANAQCKGFNYDPYLYTCKLFGSTDVQVGPKYVASSSESSYISEKWVDTVEPDSQLGVIKTAPSGADPPGVDFSNEGAYCPSMPQCNSDITQIVSSGGIQSFSTSDIQSCSSCPIRGFDRATMTVTNEIGTATTATTLDDAISKLKYSTNPNATPPSPLPPGLYTITKWSSSESMIPTQDIYYSGNGIVNTYNGVLGQNVYFDEGDTGDWVIDNSCAEDFRYKNHYYPGYTYANDTYKVTDKVFLTPVDYVSNGYVLMTSQGFLSTRDTGSVSQHVDYTDDFKTAVCDDGLWTYVLQNISVTCPGGGNSKTPLMMWSGGEYQDGMPCTAITKDVSPKYSERYNNAIFTLTPKPSAFNDFWRPYIKTNGYIHDSSGTYYSIALGAPNLSTLTLRLDAGPGLPASHGGSDQLVLTFSTSMTTQLAPDDIFIIPGVSGPCTVMSVDDKVVTVECALNGAPNIIVAGTDIQPVLMKRPFSTLYYNLLFTWYNYLYTMTPYTETYLLDMCSLGPEMTDPYADLGLFRTVSMSSATTFGVTPTVIDDPVIISSLSNLVPGLKAVEYSIDSQNPTFISVTFSVTTATVTLTSTQQTWFPSWTLDRLLSGQVRIDQFELETTNGCDPGYGEVTIGHHKYCEACAAGTYSEGGFTTCNPCTSQNYCPQGATNNTTKCAAGYYCSTPASQIQCPAGSFCPEGSTGSIECDSVNFGPTTKTTTLSADIPARTGNQTTLSLSLTDTTYALPFYVMTIPGIVGSMNVITSTMVNMFTPQPNSRIASGTPVTIQTKALSCPVGSFYVSRCPEGFRCPQSSQTLECDEGQYCNDPDDGLGVFIGARCPANQYYLPLNLDTVQSTLYGQANTDGSHCYTCPPGATVNSSQTGCVCPNAPDKVWSSQKAECISNCPPGSSPPANDDNGACTQCPAGKYSDISGDAQCFDCPTNFVSTSTADRVGCTCTTTRHDGTILTNGTTTFVPRLQRCKVTCNDGYAAFYSECLSNTVPAVADHRSYVSATQVPKTWVPAFFYNECPKGCTNFDGGGCSIYGTYIPCNYGYICSYPGPGGEGPFYDNYNGVNLTNAYGSPSCVTEWNYVCPIGMFVPDDVIRGDGTTDMTKCADCSGGGTRIGNRCYICQDTDIKKTYNGTQYQLYENTPTASGTSGVCKILDTAHLQALSPSPWGNDGALDNLPANCTSITDPKCQLPLAIVTLLQTTRLAAEAIR